ncbi:hypothetical protein L6452_42062 [Arctium lappa]|uniref:Uncharacterized protein n=1 Tax=Arctium lappa TaxID=4217 RepID=A0ACB8XJ01_ARCLA|nr:hypothetical protein L6452_42062 [Arctium lappa]
MQEFGMLHHVFHTSNVERMILSTPSARVPKLIECLIYEADQRLRDPVRGCTRIRHSINSGTRAGGVERIILSTFEYFPTYTSMQEFGMLHQVFHTSNVERMILSTPSARVPELIECLIYEADQRLRHPVRGCTRIRHSISSGTRAGGVERIILSTFEIVRKGWRH